MTSNKPIRILHVLNAMNRAGTETMLMNLYRSIDRNIIQFDFAVTAMQRCDYDDEIERMGGRIIHYPRYKGINHFAYKKWWNDFLKSHSEYHIIHGHIGSTAAIYLKIAKKYGRFTIAHSHSAGGNLTLQSFIYKLYSFNTRHIADFFIGCSYEALLNRYGKKVANDESKSCVLNNGVDTQKYIYNEQAFLDARAELGFNSNTFVIGTVGRFTEAKNPFFIVDILSELKTEISDFRFIWAGTGELFGQIKQYIKDKSLQDNVLLLGVRDDIPRIIQTLNVFILPSKYEGLPVVGVEVQAAGIPFLCSDQVSKEIDLSRCCKFISINSVKPWVEEILKEKKFRRIEDATNSIVSAGYDIHETSSWLIDLYYKKWKE